MSGRARLSRHDAGAGHGAGAPHRPAEAAERIRASEGEHRGDEAVDISTLSTLSCRARLLRLRPPRWSSLDGASRDPAGQASEKRQGDRTATHAGLRERQSAAALRRSILANVACSPVPPTAMKVTKDRGNYEEF